MMKSALTTARSLGLLEAAPHPWITLSVVRTLNLGKILSRYADLFSRKKYGLIRFPLCTSRYQLSRNIDNFRHTIVLELPLLLYRFTNRRHSFTVLMKKLLRNPILYVILVLCGYGIGFLSYDQKIFPTKSLLNLKSWVKTHMDTALGVSAKTDQIRETVFVDFRIQTIDFPPEKDGGGSLSRIGNQLILMNRFGRFFLVDTDLKSHELGKLLVPDNGYEAYESRATEGRDGLVHSPDQIRYNDVLYFHGSDRDALVISFTNWDEPHACYSSKVARLWLQNSTNSIDQLESSPDDWEILLDTNPCLPLKSVRKAIGGHVAGGRMVQADENNFFFASGDYHWDGVYAPKALAQDLDSQYGKVLKLNIHTGEPSVYSYGHRNPQGIAISEDGRLWVTEHGPRGGDELNLVVEGGNYGWPLATLGTKYNKLPWPDTVTGRHDKFRPPIYSWLPSKGISTLARIDGFHPTWDGDLLAGSLLGKTLFRLRIVNETVQFAEAIPLGERIRAIQQFASDRIAVWTDSEKLMILLPLDRDREEAAVQAAVKSMSLGQEDERRLGEAIDGCRECHSLTNINGISAPGLAGVIGRQIATTQFPYSDNLRRLNNQNWDQQTLKRFLLDPDGFARNTYMPAQNLRETTVDQLVTVLTQLSAPE